MKKIPLKLKLILFSLLIFIIQFLVWGLFELVRDFFPESYFFTWVTINLCIYFICFSFIQIRLKIKSLIDLGVLSIVQIGLSLFIVFGEDTIKIRSVDLLFYLVFILAYYFIALKGRAQKVLISLLITGFTAISFFFYSVLGSHLIAFYFYEKEYTKTSVMHRDFYYLNKDSSEITYPFKQKNKVYFIEFWNKSCPSCIKNLPEIAHLKEYYEKDTVVEIISLYCPVSDTDTREWFYNKYSVYNKGIPRMNYHYTSIGNKQKYQINGFPHFYLIDKNGNGIEGTHVFFDKNFSNNIYEKIEFLKNL